LNSEDTKRTKQIIAVMKMMPRAKFRETFIKDMEPEISSHLKTESPEGTIGYYLGSADFKRILEYADVSNSEFIEMVKNPVASLTLWQKVKHFFGG
jgi:hypothetical protein